MNYPKLVANEISDLTSKMIEVGLCVDSNFPKYTTCAGMSGPVHEVSISGFEEASLALKKRPYRETYDTLRGKRAFNMLLIDGALLQFLYRFENENLKKHILGFFPSPDLLEYQNNPEIYELDVVYTEAILKDAVTTPIRFDFDEGAFQEYRHPMSHFTIGQYKNCRIPVISGITPFRFINFVLRAFYHTPYHQYCSSWKGIVQDFPMTVTAIESADLHWSFTNA